MLPKPIRDMKKEAKHSLKGMKRVLELMEKYLSSDNHDAIRVASAFFHTLKYHMEEGDLKDENLGLSTRLRAMYLENYNDA